MDIHVLTIAVLMEVGEDVCAAAPILSGKTARLFSQILQLHLPEVV